MKKQQFFRKLCGLVLSMSLLISPGLFAFDFGGGDFGGGAPSGGDYGPPSGGIPDGPPGGWSAGYTGPMGPGGPSLGPDGPMGMPPGFEMPAGGMPDISGAQQQAIQQAMSQMQAGMTAEQQQAMQQSMQQAMQLNGAGAMPDFSKMGSGVDFNKMPAGVIPAGLMPPGGFKPGEIPSEALPPGFKLPEGMTLPPNIPVQFDLNGGIFKAPNGTAINLPTLNDFPLPKGVNGQPIEIPKMADGKIVPLPFGEKPAAAVAMNTQEFATKFANLDMNKLDQMSAESLDALYQNADAQKLDITKPEVQQRMEQLYQARNKQFGVGDVEEKLKILNGNIPEVLNVSVESLDKEIANLQAMKAGGNTNPKIDEAIAKCIDAKNSQVRANAIYQQIADLRTIKDTMVKRGQSILTQISNAGLQFTAQEQQELEEEIRTMGEGTVPGLQGKIQTLTEKYASKIQAAGATSGDFVKLATVYEKAGDMAKAQEVLGQALAKNPDDDGVATVIANFNMKANEFDKAAQVVEGMLKKNPIPQTRALYAEIKEKQGDLPVAVNYIEKAIKDAPATDAFYDKANALYSKSGDTKNFKVFATGAKVAFDTPPKVESGRTLVPVRAISEALGSDVNWDAATKKVAISQAGKKIELTMNSNMAIVDGKPVTLDVPAKIVDNRILVPLRFVGEGFNKTVDYKGESRLIAIK